MVPMTFYEIITYSLHKLQGEIQNSQPLPIPKAIGNLLVGIHLR
jgi:hypothetical protein